MSDPKCDLQGSVTLELNVPSDVMSTWDAKRTSRFFEKIAELRAIVDGSSQNGDAAPTRQRTRKGETKAEIIRALKGHPEGVPIKALLDLTGANESTIKKVLARDDDFVEKNGLWSLRQEEIPPTPTPAIPDSTDSEDSNAEGV